jgi:release factor glutamine methyltransferase
MAQTPNLADIAGLLVWGQELLRHCSDTARLDAELLLAHVLGRSRAYLGAHPEIHPATDCVGRYQDLIRRRARSEPIAYLTGEREFWSLPLTITPDVLVPRPETELVVERCLALFDSRPIRAIDLGTGSGAIALALASERPDWQIVATDRSMTALQVARANAARLGFSGVQFLHGDWFEAMAAGVPPSGFDLIVSNPPYIAAGDPHLASLRHEPAAALIAGDTGMEALEALLRQSPAHLLPVGWLVLEHGHDQGQKLRSALVAAGYARVRCHSDLAGNDRVTEAQWPARL